MTTTTPGTIPRLRSMACRASFGSIGISSWRGPRCQGHHPVTRTATAYTPWRRVPYLSRSAAPAMDAWAAASRATGTRNGEQET